MTRDDELTFLVLGRDAGGWRHYIGDVPIHAGDAIDLKMPTAAGGGAGEWIEGRYESSWRDGVPRAVFYFAGGSVFVTATMPVRVPEQQRPRFSL